MPLASNVNLKTLSRKTEGYVGSDIETLCREAGMVALREDTESEKVKNKHFREAMENIKPTATEENQEHYRRMMRKMEKVEEIETPDYYA
jgi:transitional endoplasmic reticulum ATPase